MSTEAKLWDLRMPPPSIDPTMPDATKPRFDELSKFLPVSFVFFIIFSLYSIYISCHCLPLMAHSETYSQGWTCLVIFNVITALLLACYLRSILQHPGTIPDVSSSEEGQVVWEFAPQDGRASNNDTTALDATLQEQKERKRQGDRRNCKWCNKYKPDRCHHCRVCRMCILKMDHHCPWIYNCVGFKNFKYFFLLVFYAAVASNFVLWTMSSTVRKMINEPGSDSFLRTFVVLFGESLAGLMAFLLTSFLAFHIHLMIRAMTTIEFCEKSRHPNFDNGVYSLGVLRNVQAVLGDNVFLWLLPINPPSGNGVKFSTPADDNSMILGDDIHAKFDYGTAQKRGKHGTGAGTGEAPDSDVQQKGPTYSGH